MNNNAEPLVEWDGSEFHIVLPIEDKIVDVKITPALTYVARIRESGTDEWSAGFVTPFTHAEFVGLKPDTEYEFEVRPKNDAGEGAPSYSRARTDSSGAPGNVIPFPGPDSR